MNRRRPSFRLLRRLVVLLLIGAALNVLVAWGCAVARVKRGLLHPAPAMTQPYPEIAWPAGAPADRSAVCIVRARSVGVGYTYLEFTEPRPPAPDLGSRTAVSVRFGLPARSMEYSGFLGFPGQRGLLIWRYWDIGAATRWLGLGGRFGEQLPLQPRAVGFALNSVFYAGVVYGAVRLVGAGVRRRRRARSRCERCGYDVGGVERCPECGLGVRA